MTRSAPARAKARPKYWPSPRLAPVTSATLPARSKRFVLITAAQYSDARPGRQHNFEQTRLIAVEPVKPGRSFLERGMRAEQRGDPYRPARNHLQASRVLAARGAGT